MYMDPSRLRALLKKYMDDDITAEELRELSQYVQHADDPQVLEQLVDDLWKEHDTRAPQALPSSALYRAILQHPELQADPPIKGEKHQRMTWLRIAGAAAVVLISATLFWYGGLITKPLADDVGRTVATVAIVPGGNKATLTLANGHVVNLSETQNGIVLGEELTYVDGSGVLEAGLSYRLPDISRQPTDIGDPLSTGGQGRRDKHIAEAPPLMSLTTPNGGTYQVTLSDGTKVWLNSASILRYPMNFSGSQREVELEGEAFFEVAPKKVPFFVKTREQVVEVLGTQFNITGYPDEAEVRTTLVEGSVRVVNSVSNAAKQLSPGKQSIVRGRRMEIRDVETEPYIAWKKGYFAFPDEHISRVMNTIARWYDIEVEYQGDMTHKYFGGTLSRFEDFETLLQTIELTGSVRFKIEGRRVIVMT